MFVTITCVDKKRFNALMDSRASIYRFHNGIKKGHLVVGRLLVKKAQEAIMKPPKTGIIYKLTKKQAMRASKKLHQASAPGEAPANLFGQLRKSVTAKLRGQDLEWGYDSSTEYGNYLENGSKKIKKRPNILPRSKENTGNAQTYYEREIKNQLYYWLR